MNTPTPSPSLPSDPSLPPPPPPPSPADVSAEALAKEGPVPRLSKRLWLLAGLGILVAGILVGLLGSNVLYQSSNQFTILPTSILTPTPTLMKRADIFADWKTYTNTAFRYSIKYPNDWNANSIGPGIGTIPLDNVQRGLLLTPPIPTPAGGMGVPTEDIHIRIEIDSRQTSGETYEEWVNSTKKDLNDTTNSILESEIASTKTIVIKTGFKIIYLQSSPDRVYFYYIETQAPTSENQKIIDQILSTFRFLDAVSPTPTTSQSTPVQTNGVELKDIRYTLPSGWAATLNPDNLHLAPTSGGGYLYIEAFNYPGTTGRRDFYCQLHKYCIAETVFTETTIGNIAGYKATRLDNSGGGSEYFGAKGNKFYIISTYAPPSPNDFDNYVQSVLSSLIF